MIILKGGVQMLDDLKISEFLEVLGSDTPAPGGGSVAALAGALSASLVTMVSRLSKKATDQSRIQEIVNLSDQLSGELQQLIEKDTQAFNQVMAAYKLAKDTEAEKAARSQAIQQGMKNAALIPLSIMEKTLAVLELANEISRLGNQNAITDVGVAGLLGLAAVKGAGYNVQINLLSIKDDDFKRELADRLYQLNIKADQLAKVIENAVEQSMGI